MNKAKAAAEALKVNGRRRRNGANGTRGNGGNNGSSRGDRVRPRHGRGRSELDAAIQDYSDVYEFAPVGYVTLDGRGRIEAANLFACRLLNTTRDHLVANPFSLYVTREDLDLFLRHLFRCRKGEPRVETNLHLRKVGGETLSVFLSSTPSEGSRAFPTTIVDLSERERAERELREKEQELERIVTQTPFMLTRCTRDLRYRYVSEAYAKVAGVSSDQLAGKPIAEVIGEEGLKTIRPYIDRVLTGETVSYEAVIPFHGRRERFLHVVYVPDRTRDGEVVGWIASMLDITERKKQETQLAEQARLLDLTHDAVIVRDFEGRISFWNRGAEELYGFSARQALGKLTHKLLQTRHPEALPSILRKLRRDRRWSGELEHLRRDGSPITVLSRWALDHNEGKSIILESNTDITERKKAEQRVAEAARQQAALYKLVQDWQAAKSVRDIYESALDAIATALSCERAAILLFHGRKGMRFVAWRGLSDRYRRAVEGHSPWRPDTRNAQPVCLEDIDRAELPRELKATIKREGIRAAAFIPLVGHRRLIGKVMAYYKERHRFTKGDIELALTIARQTVLGIEHLSSDQALRESEARLRALVEQATAGMARCDTSGRIIFANQRYCKMLGYSESELLGKTIREVTYPGDVERGMALFRKMVREGVPYEIEKRFVRKNGSILWADVSASAVRGEDGKAHSAVAVVVDVTARKKAEGALQKSRNMLEQLVHQRTRALRSANRELENEIRRRKGLEGQILEISDREQERLGQELHDGLCQQLTAIGFLARATALRLRDHRVVQQEDLEKIAQLINNSVMDARNIARDLHKEEIEAAEFVQALRDLVERKIWQTSCRLELKTEVQIEDDRIASQLYRIFREAIINANKHARAKQIVLEVKREKRDLVMSVTDDGVGLNRATKGHGLGFHIMKYRAESIGARLELESLKKGGTRVACYLPLSKTK
ncbi:MAG TPA: PAS domain S-box protein [Chthoniobacterales bacterium]|nr:PAS domain S-box protein [Chthoniobacterales bacterium]